MGLLRRYRAPNSGIAVGMIGQDLLREQMVCLRAEIRDASNRVFRVLTFGILVTPTAAGIITGLGESSVFMEDSNFEILSLILPFLAIAFGLVYLSESNAVMRLGEYIRKEIDPHFPQNVTGWESWLERPQRRPVDRFWHRLLGDWFGDWFWHRRLVDRLRNACFFLLQSLYFGGTAFLAVAFVHSRFKAPWSVLAGALYAAVAFLFLVFLLFNLRASSGDSPLRSTGRAREGASQ